MTWSPSARPCVPVPTLSTTPAPSSPSTMGTGTPFQLPSAAWRQLWQTPLAVMRTVTSPARGGSSSSSSVRSGLPCSKSTDARMASSSARVADAGIEVPVEEIDGEVDDHEENRDEEDGALGHGIVALVDRPEHETAHAGEREHFLDDHRAAQEDAGLEPGHGDHRDERVLERVLQDHAPPGQTLGGSRAHVLRAQHVEHAGARGARDVGGARRAEAHHGQ